VKGERVFTANGSGPTGQSTVCGVFSSGIKLAFRLTEPVFQVPECNADNPDSS